ncbi:MAG: PAS domain S-box protein [Aquabacterium sp.]|uniref:hybrid sensor histidine kinase/response regulator n=1 Tax=Aquabacterium sp. TaxID=1872578 RepID=UPI00271EE143|nr:PAS domain S-box protein [Aquabacterium sp.]MDO9002524.1 PAS domain S-box protein [Aquabacterium sp.]
MSLRFLDGGGAMGALIRAQDWASTPLGRPADWPQPLKTIVGVMLGANQAMFAAWGPQQVMFYNDLYADILGGHHPAALGRPFAEVWYDIIDEIGPIMAKAYAGVPTSMEDIELTMLRHGRAEETHFSFFYTPLRDENGDVQGVFCACNEITAQVFAERERVAELERLRALFEQSPSFVAVLRGPEHVFELANPAYLKIVSRQDILGKTVLQALPEVADQGFLALLDQVYRSGEPFSGRAVPVLLSSQPGMASERRFLDFVYQPIFDNQGAVTGIFVEGVDVTAAHEAAQALAASNDQLARAQAAGGVGIFTLDLLQNMLTVTPEMCRIFGLPEQAQVAPDTFEKLVISDDVEMVSSLATRTNGELPLKTEYRIRRPDNGQIRWIARSAEFQCDEQGRRVRLVGVVQDVTERHQAEQILRESEEKFRTFAQVMPNHVWTSPRNGQLDWFNERTLAYSGLSHEQLTGQGWTQIVHPDDLQRASLAWTQALSSGQIYEIEFRIRRADGAYRWHLVRAHPICSGDGTLIRWIGTNTDIEDQRLASEALLAMNATLEQRIEARTEERDRVWRNSQDLLVVVGGDGLFRDVNPAWTRILGFSREEIMGQHVNGLIHPDDRTATLNALAYATHDVLVQFENRFRHKDGGHRWFSWTASPDSSGLVYGNGRHITAEKEAETALQRTQDALRQAQKMEAIGQLTGGVAHDFNNVLQVIGGNLQLLREATRHDESLQRRVDAAIAGVDRGAKLALHLLAFARKQPLAPDVLNIGRRVQDLDDMLRRVIGDSIDLKTRVARNLWNTFVDPHGLENVLLNLAINARDAMNGAGELTLETANVSLDDTDTHDHPDVTPGQYVMISLSDTGSGMPPEILERVFEPFFTTKSEGHGTGLGLSMVYGFIKQSGGHVKIDSEVGCGTTVKLYLPRSHQTQETMLPEFSGPVTGGDETILVVEDDPQVRETVVALLSELGYTVLKSPDATSALAILQSGVPIDLLFTDVVMPGTLRSPELAELARELHPDIEVLFTSGYTEDAIVHGGRLDPGVALLSKPYRREDLARKIRHMFVNRKFAATLKAHVRANRLEALATPQAKPEAPTTAHNAPPGLRILVVEDEEDSLRSMLEILELSGYTAVGAPSAESALELLDQAKFDVLMTDISLPGMSGREFAALARERQPLKVIFASGYGPRKDELVDAVWLQKPFDFDVLFALLEELGSAMSA